MAVINRLNEAELASKPLKDAAEKLYLALSLELPDLDGIKRLRDRISVKFDWTNEMHGHARPFLKANGGKFHDEFRELWEQAMLDVRQPAVDAARKWLQEQFQIGVVAEDGPAEQPSAEPNELPEQPADDHASDGPASDNQADSVADLQTSQVENH